MPVNTSFTIELKSNPNIVAPYATSEPNDWTIGDTTPFTFEIPEADFGTFEDYERHAGAYSPMQVLSNDRKYREQFESPAIDSLVWGIRPSSDLQNRNVVGVWGLVDSITNERPQSLSTNRYSVSVFVLARYSEYADHASVEADLLV